MGLSKHFAWKMNKAYDSVCPQHWVSLCGFVDCYMSLALAYNVFSHLINVDDFAYKKFQILYMIAIYLHDNLRHMKWFHMVVSEQVSALLDVCHLIYRVFDGALPISLVS